MSDDKDDGLNFDLNIKWKEVLFVGIVVVLVMVVTAALVYSTPVPFPKKVRAPVAITRSSFVGDWVMYWGDMRVNVKLRESGQYVCRWGTLEYVGSWGLAGDGRLWITESSQPQEARAWQNYVIRLKPGTMSGKIELGAPGLNFRLEKGRKAMR